MVKKVISKASLITQVLTLLALLAVVTTGAYSLLIEVAGLGAFGWCAVVFICSVSLYAIIEIIKRSI